MTYLEVTVVIIPQQRVAGGTELIFRIEEKFFVSRAVGVVTKGTVAEYGWFVYG